MVLRKLQECSQLATDSRPSLFYCTTHCIQAQYMLRQFCPFVRPYFRLFVCHMRDLCNMAKTWARIIKLFYYLVESHSMFLMPNTMAKFMQIVFAFMPRL